jgi:anti-anti-sigma factor
LSDIASDQSGKSGRCPACGSVIEPGRSTPSAEARCPGCGQRLWFLGGNPGDARVIELHSAGNRPAELDEIIAQIPKGARIGDLVLDFGKVRGLYSADLAKLISLKRQVDAAGGRLEIRNLHPDLREVFRITRLDKVFNI